uniref:Uncharacterized protein n=1 Tax=Manihot esculenta TaxID=3983 RepID=A0A2C9UTA9_MANES
MEQKASTLRFRTLYSWSCSRFSGVSRALLGFSSSLLNTIHFALLDRSLVSGLYTPNPSPFIFL